jgi:hypothetical protein
VILLGITFIVMPMRVTLVGGPANLFYSLPPVSFDHTDNDVHYTEHWLLAIVLISSLGFAAGGHQRFYSVKKRGEKKEAEEIALVTGRS